jgi:hypothetical protein
MNGNLRLLSILYYVYGGLIMFTGVAMLVFVLVGRMIATGAMELEDGSEVPPWLGALFAGMGWGLFLVFLIWGMVNVACGRWIAGQRNRTASQVVAGINCLNMPLGLALGIFTFITLNNAEVKQAYERSALERAAGGAH